MTRIMRSSHQRLEGYDLNQISDARVLPALRAILDHEEGYYEGPFKPGGTLVKADLYITLHTTPLVNEKHEYKGGIAQIEDITEQVKSERKIQRLEERFTKAFYTSPDAININRATDGVYLDCNRSFIELTGYTRDEIIGKSSIALGIWVNPEDRTRLVKGLQEKGDVKNLEAEFRMKDGRILTGLMSASLLDVDGEQCILSVTRDISEIKKAQLAIQESEERYRTIFDTVPVSLWEQDFLTVYDILEMLRADGVTDLAGYLDAHPGIVEKAVRSVIVRDMNDESLVIFKAKSKAELFSSIDIMFREESYTNFRSELQAIWDKKPIYNGETINQTIDGQPIVVNVTYRIPVKREEFAHILVSITDTTARKAAEEQVGMQVQHLAALRAVDMAISASMDLPIVLRVLLNQVQQQLKVHSASILLFNQATQKLVYAAGSGFKSRAVERTNLGLGESYAGKAALERRIVAADDLSTSFSQIATEGFRDDGFTDYLGIPLISKGSVKGVLEIFNRGKLPQDAQWMNLLDSMASQAAIAIDNATLFDDAQKANINLRQAYDATIEGWARALELRDGDTEGHSKRVADMTVLLAREVGIKEADMVDLRRGALLHDIGKMGIPDTILLKPAALTDEEWVIMRKHPTLGKGLLEPIEFLKNSMDIPYCHHEKWDGTGYPRGLKGEEIPLMARVFSVIDGWDALRSDRPYRKALSDADAWNIIEENSGKAYEPDIVHKFKDLIKKA
jgi:PAS domain S-box-containing protein/putative nucleotidyltransferase with HDIG domain